ncbi:MAG: PEP/pyruvate-binding domain-containing protein [Candidatus Eisenbacteria bacterium]
MRDPQRRTRLPRFDRGFFASGRSFCQIGDGDIGGKAQGLVLVDDTLREEFAHERFPHSEVRIPTTVVLSTDVFDAFLSYNGLTEIALSDEPDYKIAQAFQAGSLPAQYVGDLQSFVDQVRIPLAVRSSSLLEDALERPFAGVYETKMTPNNQADPAERFRKLIEAIKFVYASTFFRAAKSYRAATGHGPDDERMAVVLQEVVGSRRWNRHYPVLSAVGRTYNYYATGSAQPEEGVVSLALGLGKTIVDGGACWTYSPKHPAAPPPYGSTSDLLRYSQNRFWAVELGSLTKPYDPIVETEFLTEGDLGDAESDGVLEHVASTVDPQSDRIVSGVSQRGPRVVNFAPLLKRSDREFNDVVERLLAVSRARLNADVEIELAIDMSRERARDLFGFLQVRPMMVSDRSVSLDDDELARDDLLLASSLVVGNGILETVQDVVYVKPAAFQPGQTHPIAGELAGINTMLVDEGRPYLLLGFGRWGSTDPGRRSCRLGTDFRARAWSSRHLAGLPRADPSQGCISSTTSRASASCTSGRRARPGRGLELARRACRARAETASPPFGTFGWTGRCS